MGFRSKMAMEALKYTGKGRCPLILNLEISHSCNLFCKACGRVRTPKNGNLSINECKAAITKTGAPLIYFTGGEPLLNKSLPEIVDYALENDRIVFVVTNGVLLKDRISEFVKNENLVFEVSIDGLKEQHNHIRGEGVFEKALQGIKHAKSEGFKVYTNMTIYKVNSGILEALIQYFNSTVDAFYFMPLFNFFETGESLNRKDIKKVGEELLSLYKDYPSANTVSYLAFLKGQEIKCTPWGTVTLDPNGWKSPCYFITEDYYPTFDELRENTEWDKFEKKEDKRCKMCFSHCGHEPTVVRDKKLLGRHLLANIPP
ncbi:MAG: adenosyl-hopene transferase HpnH [Candidatus Hydrothermarchaeales archaeon]